MRATDHRSVDVAEETVGATAQRAIERYEKSYRNAALAILAVTLLTTLACGIIAFVEKTATSQDAVYLEVVEEHVATTPFTILLIGSDSREGTALYTGKENERSQVNQYADIMTLACVDPVARSIALVTVPRDTWHDGRKINAALENGDPLEVVTAVENLTGASIDYYVMTDFINFEELVDGIGGVVVDVPVKVTVADPATAEDVTVLAGENQQLSGAETLALSRARKEYGKDQDALRQVNVRSVEIALIDSVLSGKVGIPLALGMLNTCTTNNLDMGMLKWIAEDFGANYSSVSYYSGTGPYHGSTRSSDEQWIVPSDETMWQTLLEAVYAGADPATVIAPPSFE